MAHAKDLEVLNGTKKAATTEAVRQSPEPQSQQASQQPKAPLHNANLALTGLTARQGEHDATNDAKVYAAAYSQAYSLEVLRLKGQFLQSFHNQNQQSQTVARDAITQNNQEDFFAAANELEGLITQINNYQPPQLPAPQYNLLPPSLA